MISRRGLLGFIAAAPFIVKASSLMPVKALIGSEPDIFAAAPLTWEEITQTTLRARSAILAENVAKYNALLHRLTHGGVAPFTEGLVA